MQNAIIFFATIITMIAVLFVVNLINKAIEYLKLKSERENNASLADLVSAANTAIIQAVGYVNQTYVDALKVAGTFDETAQAEAYNKAVSLAMQMITEDGAQAITELFGSIQDYLETRIETSVRKLKNKEE